MGESAKTTGDFTGRSVVVIGATGALGAAVWVHAAGENADETREGELSCISSARLTEPHGIVRLTWFLRGGALGFSRFEAVSN
jgi:hypothetical protein